MSEYDAIKSNAEEIARKLIGEIGPGQRGAMGRRIPTWADEVSFAIAKAVKQSMPVQVDQAWCMQVLVERPQILSMRVVHGAPIELSGVVRGAVADLIENDIERDLREFQIEAKLAVEAANEPASEPGMKP